MPRASVKEDKNIYFQKREELGLTREKASELLESISPERIEKIENERCEPHPEEILIMADKYKAPELCNHYCSKQCPIGRVYVPEVKMEDLSKIVLRMLSYLNSVQSSRERLIDIAADGKVDWDEVEEFITIQENLKKIAAASDELQLWSEQMIADGVIDVERYRAVKERKKEK